jgi:GWxTD domain-containing protein
MNYAIDQIGLAMAYSFVDMAAVGALVWVALRVSRGLAPALRYWFALAGLAASIVPFAAQFTGGQTAAGVAVKLEWPAALASAWIIGVVVFSLRFLGGWVVLQRRINAARAANLPNWPNLCRRIGLRKPALLKVSDTGDSPFAARIWRPVVVIPAATLAGLPADQLEAILLHELAHIRRADYAVELAQRVLETIFFYHPAIWLLSSAVRTEREKACDDAAVKADADPAAFARALMTLEDLRAPQLALAASSSSVAERVRRLLNQDRHNNSLAPLFAALLLLAIPALSQITPYTKWLSEDVVYIIETPEKAAFERLQSDPERQKFIEQFWQRRGEAAKEEHYRRIQYANQRFKADTTPGWRTEKGRTYIKFGPPDEIESHPRQGYEQWRYKEIPNVGSKVIFEFGERRNAPPPPPPPPPPKPNDDNAARLQRELERQQRQLELQRAENDAFRLKQELEQRRALVNELNAQVIQLRQQVRELGQDATDVQRLNQDIQRLEQEIARQRP